MSSLRQQLHRRHHIDEKVDEGDILMKQKSATHHDVMPNDTKSQVSHKQHVPVLHQKREPKQQQQQQHQEQQPSASSMNKKAATMKKSKKMKPVAMKSHVPGNVNIAALMAAELHLKKMVDQSHEVHHQKQQKQRSRNNTINVQRSMVPFAYPIRHHENEYSENYIVKPEDDINNNNKSTMTSSANEDQFIDSVHFSSEPYILSQRPLNSGESQTGDFHGDMLEYARMAAEDNRDLHNSWIMKQLFKNPELFSLPSVQRAFSFVLDNTRSRVMLKRASNVPSVGSKKSAATWTQQSYQNSLQYHSQPDPCDVDLDFDAPTRMDTHIAGRISGPIDRVYSNLPMAGTPRTRNIVTNDKSYHFDRFENRLGKSRHSDVNREISESMSRSIGRQQSQMRSALLGANKAWEDKIMRQQQKRQAQPPSLTVPNKGFGSRKLQQMKSIKKPAFSTKQQPNSQQPTSQMSKMQQQQQQQQQPQQKSKSSIKKQSKLSTQQQSNQPIQQQSNPSINQVKNNQSVKHGQSIVPNVHGGVMNLPPIAAIAKINISPSVIHQNLNKFDDSTINNIDVTSQPVEKWQKLPKSRKPHRPKEQKNVGQNWKSARQANAPPSWFYEYDQTSNNLMAVPITRYTIAYIQLKQHNLKERLEGKKLTPINDRRLKNRIGKQNPAQTILHLLVNGPAHAPRIPRQNNNINKNEAQMNTSNNDDGAPVHGNVLTNNYSHTRYGLMNRTNCQRHVHLTPALLHTFFHPVKGFAGVSHSQNMDQHTTSSLAAYKQHHEFSNNKQQQQQQQQPQQQNIKNNAPSSTQAPQMMQKNPIQQQSNNTPHKNRAHQKQLLDDEKVEMR